MYVYNTNDFPYVEFGDEIKRQIRIVLEAMERIAPNCSAEIMAQGEMIVCSG